MIRHLIMTMAALGLISGTARAQPVHSFEELRHRIAVGDTVYVFDTSGQAIRGRVAMLSADVLTLDTGGAQRSFSGRDIRRVDRRRRDSVRNGILIGAASGALVGFRIGKGLDSPACPRAGVECGQGAMLGLAGGAFWGAAGGWLADALIRKREIVYLRAMAGNSSP
jgi:hypothetical protein